MSNDEFLQRIVDCTLSKGAVTYEGFRHSYSVVSADLARGLPNFVGVYKDLIFISSDTPEEYRPHVVLHELHCLARKKEGHQEHCLEALCLELSTVPEMIKKDYILMRRRFFRDLVEYTERNSPESDLLPAVRTSLKYLEEFFS